MGVFTVMIVIAPIFYVVFRRRFAFAFFITWFLMVATQQAAVAHSHALYYQGLLKGLPADPTSVGLTVFSGWLLAYPYCGVLYLIRLLLVRFGFLSSEIKGITSSKVDLTNDQE